jgi:hypothetical protein
MLVAELNEWSESAEFQALWNFFCEWISFCMVSVTGLAIQVTQANVLWRASYVPTYERYFILGSSATMTGTDGILLSAELNIYPTNQPTICVGGGGGRSYELFRERTSRFTKWKISAGIDVIWLPVLHVKPNKQSESISHLPSTLIWIKLTSFVIASGIEVNLHTEHLALSKAHVRAWNKFKRSAVKFRKRTRKVQEVEILKLRKRFVNSHNRIRC